MSRTFILLILLACKANAQELSHRQYTVKDGLPGAVVYHSLQDKNGYVWFATNQGVSRFDGRTFKNYSKEDGLPDNEIVKLYLDRHDNLWFVSFSGIPSVLYHGAIRSFAECKGVISITEDFVTDSILLISSFTENNIPYAGNYRSANRPGKWFFQNSLQLINNQQPVLKKSSGKKIDFFFSLADINTYSIAVKDSNTVYRHRFVHKKEDYDLILYNPKIVFELLSDKQSVLFFTDSFYIAGRNGIRAFMSMKELQLKQEDIACLYCENDSTLWLCTRNKGLIRIKNFQDPHRSIRSYFPGIYCTSMLKDRENGFWVTTYNDGVLYIPNPDSWYLPEFSGASAKNIRVIRNAGQQLMAGAADGSIALFEPANFTARLFHNWNSQNKNNRVLDVCPYGKNKFIIASDYGLYILSRDDNHKRIGLLSGIKGIVRLTDTSVLAALSFGVMQESFLKGTMKLLFEQRTTCIAGEGTVNYWGTLHGLYKLSNDSISWLGQSYPFLRNAINHIDIGPGGALWISTLQGLAILKNGVLTIITRKQGLQGSICKHVLPENNIAWVSTDKGISRISYSWNNDTAVYTIGSITENDGLLSDDVNQCARAGNYIWAATARGISVFPGSYTVNFTQPPPLINIDRIVFGDHEILPGETAITDYRKNKLQVEVSGISFRSGNQVRYDYRLADIDSNWDTGSGHLIDFSILPFGTHRFEVRAIDRWGTASSEVKSFYFTIHPPFWKTSWFIFLSYCIPVLLISLAVYFFYRSRQRIKDKKYQLEKKMYQLEIMALKAQMNPHFIFNCLSSIQHYIIRADIENANLYLHKFSVLIRNILEKSTESDIALAEEIKLLESYLELEALRMGDRMRYNISIGENILQHKVQIPAMLLQPYVENAIRHGINPLHDRQGIIRIAFQLEKNFLVCTIEDNGIGINASLQSKHHSLAAHRSMGTGITGHRINIINAINKNKMELEVKDKKDIEPGSPGTMVRISFPLQ